MTSAYQEQYQDKYHAYLKSEAWQAKRRLVFRRAKGICERCDGRSGCQEFHVHHYSYKNVFCESLDDLGFLCSHCHDVVHGFRVDDPLRKNHPDEPENWIEDMKRRIARI